MTVNGNMLHLFSFFLWLSITVSCTAVDQDEAVKEKGKAAKKIYHDIISKHEFHIRKGFDCYVCHKEIEEFIEEKVSDKEPEAGQEIVLSMICCVTCHRSYGKQTLCVIDLPNRLVECRICHRDIRKDSKPQYHYQNWLARHGNYVDISEKVPDECAICHKRSGCTDCHRSRKPTNHNNFWRQRAHGLVAGYNRERCTICHTSDYCIRCHSNTTPQNHDNSWLARHCMTCHEPLSSTNCSVCHKTAHRK